MGIVQAISRVKESVRKTGLESVVAGLGEQLRSNAIPAPLRPAATRLADLLRVPEAVPVVSLAQAISKSDAHAQTGASHDELAAQGGVCPFSGMNAGLAGLLDASQFEGPAADAASLDAASFEAPALETEHATDARASSSAAIVDAEWVPRTETPKRASRDSGIKKSKPIAQVRVDVRAAPAPTQRAAPKRVATKASAKAAPKAVHAAHGKASTKAIPKSEPAPKSKKSHSVAEKDSEKVAARPATSKTPARSKDSATKSTAKRPTAKAVSKKN